MKSNSFDFCHAVFDSGVLIRLQRTMEYWQNKGLSYVPLPWIVPQSIMDCPKPPWIEAPDIATIVGPLVASGEQSFLWLSEQGRLPVNPRGYIGWSPCFRRENYDHFHHHYFIKAELFIPVMPKTAELVLEDVISGSEKWFATLANEAGLPIRRRVLSDQIDLELDNVELGSYGVRETPSGVPYVFGTALAEPRWTEALADYRDAYHPAEIYDLPPRPPPSVF